MGVSGVSGDIRTSAKAKFIWCGDFKYLSSPCDRDPVIQKNHPMSIVERGDASGTRCSSAQ